MDVHVSAPTKSLSSYEIACVTGGVPATGDALLDKIILQSLRFRTAAEFAKTLELDEAIRRADELINKFSKKPD